MFRYLLLYTSGEDTEGGSRDIGYRARSEEYDVVDVSYSDSI